MEERICELLHKMSREDKVRLVAGATIWTTSAVYQPKIPELKVTDGPNGARGDKYLGREPTTCWPVGIALASTWNPDLISQVGQALAQEVHDKGAHVLLGPTVNMHRSPLNGRNSECYSEVCSGRRVVTCVCFLCATMFVNGESGLKLGAWRSYLAIGIATNKGSEQV